MVGQISLHLSQFRNVVTSIRQVSTVRDFLEATSPPGHISYRGLITINCVNLFRIPSEVVGYIHCYDRQDVWR